MIALGSLLPACGDRNRAGTQGNTGDGGVQDTATKYDTSIPAKQDSLKRDTATTPAHR